MRILFLVHSLRRGGAERVLLEVALGLRAKGHMVEVASWLDVDEYQEERYAPVPRRFLMRKEDYSWPWGVPAAAKALKDAVEKFKPDIIEMHTPTVAWVAAWAELKIPYLHVLQGYGAIVREGSFKDWAVRTGDRFAENQLNADFIVSAAPMAEVAAKHFAVASSRFVCVPNGIDVLAFHPPQKPLLPAPVIMMLGTLAPHKGQAFAIPAMTALLEQVPGAKLMIVGDGPDRLRLEALVKEAGLDGKIEILGRRKDAFELMSASHIFWHLSESEGLPMVILEAMASGLPVVGFDVRGTRDAVANGETGRLLPFKDTDGVAQATAAVLKDPASYQAMALKARRRAETNFSLEAMVAGHEKALAAAAGKLNP